MNKWHKITLSILIVAVTLTVVLWPPALRVQADDYLILLQLYTNNPPVINPPTLDIVFNPTGTHVHKDYLKVRLDFYPNEGDKSYEQQDIEKPIIPESGYLGKVDEFGEPLDWDDYNKWIESLPTEWVTNPCLCLFIIVPPDITAIELEEYILRTFHADVTATIDDIMIAENSAHLISAFMRDKLELQAEKIVATDEPTLLDTVNSRLSGTSISASGGDGEIEDAEPKSIDVGTEAIDRPSAVGQGYCIIAVENPSNADGTIDTVEVWFDGIQATNVSVANFFNVSGTNFTTRDHEDIGVVDGGSKQTFTPLDMDIETGDYIGYHSITTGMVRTLAGSGYWYYNGDQIPCTNQTFSLSSARTISLYGTGEEAGGDPSISNTPASKAFGVVAASSTFWSNGSEPSWPLTDGDAYFTITNDGSIAIDIDIYSTDFDGGGGWNLVTGSPGSREARLLAYKEGDGNTDNITVLNTPTSFISSLASSADIDWELRMDVPTVSDKYQHSANITLEASAS